jgi:hypothetical protein
VRAEEEVMRTPEEIDALWLAAKFQPRLRESEDPPLVELLKGEPPIFVCAEQAMCIHLPGSRVALRVMGPITRMAMALHLGLTREEAESIGLTAEAAQDDCMDETRRIIAEVKARAIARGDTEAAEMFTGKSSPIPPHDPRWGRTQTVEEAAADPDMNKAARP